MKKLKHDKNDENKNNCLKLSFKYVMNNMRTYERLSTHF